MTRKALSATLDDLAADMREHANDPAMVELVATRIRNMAVALATQQLEVRG